jgi:hypothetical protein
MDIPCPAPARTSCTVTGCSVATHHFFVFILPSNAAIAIISGPAEQHSPPILVAPVHQNPINEAYDGCSWYLSNRNPSSVSLAVLTPATEPSATTTSTHSIHSHFRRPASVTVFFHTSNMGPISPNVICGINVRMRSTISNACPQTSQAAEFALAWPQSPGTPSS